MILISSYNCNEHKIDPEKIVNLYMALKIVFLDFHSYENSKENLIKFFESYKTFFKRQLAPFYIITKKSSLKHMKISSSNLLILSQRRSSTKNERP
jgi:hypothetical protein